MLMAISLESIPVLTTAFFRLLLAGILLGFFVLYKNEPVAIDKLFLQQTAVLGLLRAALPITLILWAQTRIDSGVAGILNSTSALFTLLVAHVFTSTEKISMAKLIGVILGMLGVALMMGTDAINGLGRDVIGQLAMLGATLSYGFANVYSKTVTAKSPAVSASGNLLMGALCILPFATIMEWPVTQWPTARSVVAILALAIFSTATAFVVWFTLVRSIGASNTSLVTFLIPPIALLLGITVLGETPDAFDYAGFVFIAAGLWISQYSR